MSATANWSYTNTATIRPFLGMDQWTQAATYGAEFQIMCTWAAQSDQSRDASGAEFVSRHKVWTEDKRPKYLDMIKLAGSDEWEEIRSVTNWDMSPFGEEPDFLLVT